MLDEVACEAGLIYYYAGCSMVILVLDLPLTMLTFSCSNGQHLLARRLEHRFRDSCGRMLLG